MRYENIATGEMGTATAVQADGVYMTSDEGSTIFVTNAELAWVKSHISPGTVAAAQEAQEQQWAPRPCKHTWTTAGGRLAWCTKCEHPGEYNAATNEVSYD